jgi:hypothetical protein
MSGCVIIALLHDLVLIGVPPLQMFLHVACFSSQVFATIKAYSYLGATDTLCTGELEEAMSALSSTLIWQIRTPLSSLK